MEDFIYYNNLFLIYKDLLKDSNRDIFDLYYGDNLSMQEIADIKNISKSRVGIIIKNVTRELDKYEEVLKLYEKEKIINELLEYSDIKIIKNKLKEIIKGE